MTSKLEVDHMTWDLSDFYDSARDPRLESDLAAALERAAAFAQRYRGTIDVPGGPSAERMAAAVAELESICEQADRPGIYAQLMHAADSRPPEHGALVAMTMERGSEIRNRLLFFDLEWLAVQEDDARRVIEAPACARYRHYLSSARRYRQHTLSEPEEKLLEQTANTGRRAFCRLFDQVLSALTFEVEVGKKRRRLNESGVLALLHDPRREVRRKAATALTEKLIENGIVLTHVFNVIVQEHAMSDRLRRYEDPMSARHLANEIDGPTVQALLCACDDGAELVADYYRLKRRILGLDVLCDYDRYAPVDDTSRRHSWDEARDIVLGAYEDFSPRMREVAERFFAGRWIDATVREGKAGGAFSSSALPSLHPYVLLNYLGSASDVMTLAHELGHGVHQYLSRERGYFQAHTPLTMAETASVFGEMLVFERLRKQRKDPRAGLALLCSFIEEAFGTVFRQATLTRFERELHERRRAEGELSSEQIGAIWLAANAEMYGDSVRLTDGYRWWWAYIPHFLHAPFYCYAYSFGELLVLALYEMYRDEGPSFVPRYLQLLERGGSESPAELLAHLGVDTTEPEFWKRGLGVLRALIAEAKSLANSLPVESRPQKR